ncbi:MAG: DUF302 domain-containing protein [Pseudomonadota bacterium]
MNAFGRLLAAASGGLLLFLVGPVAADTAAPYPGTEVLKTAYGFSDLRGRLETSVEKNGMFVVTAASASAGAKARGLTIPGNIVIGVYRNDFAVRMLEASVPAGIEAPLRFYLTENADGTSTLTYRKPSAVFAPYGSSKLDAMAKELDGIWAKIVGDAIGP